MFATNREIDAYTLTIHLKLDATANYEYLENVKKFVQ